MNLSRAQDASLVAMWREWLEREREFADELAMIRSIAASLRIPTDEAARRLAAATNPHGLPG